MRIFSVTLAVIYLMFSSSAVAFTYKAQQLQSKEGIVSLIELFTSEGCHSCPPAEHWLNDLKNKTNLWRDFVPVAFHVDYWDYLGWNDVYAKPEHSQRQKLYAAENQEPAAYTPGVRAEGKEFSFWRRANMGKLDGVERPTVGTLSVSINKDGTFSANFELSEKANPEKLGIRGQPYFITVALLGMGISTEVERGENAGKTLEHDFVVLESIDYEVNNGSWRGKLPTTTVSASSYAIAAWVSSNKSLKPIQAVGAYLD